jgi:hypothetical protein
MNIKAYMLLSLCSINLALAEANQQSDPFMAKLTNLSNQKTEEFYQEWLDTIKILKESSNEVLGESNGDLFFSPIITWPIYNLLDRASSPSLEGKNVTIADELSQGETTLKYTINKKKDGTIAAYITITDPEGTERKEYRTPEIKEDEVISNKLKEYPTLQKKYKHWLKKIHNLESEVTRGIPGGRPNNGREYWSCGNMCIESTMHQDTNGNVTGYFRITDQQGSAVHEYCSPQKIAKEVSA